jgi:hypothetical protein
VSYKKVALGFGFGVLSLAFSLFVLRLAGVSSLYESIGDSL